MNIHNLFKVLADIIGHIVISVVCFGTIYLACVWFFGLIGALGYGLIYLQTALASEEKLYVLLVFAASLYFFVDKYYPDPQIKLALAPSREVDLMVIKVGIVLLVIFCACIILI